MSTYDVEITADGYLRIDPALAAERFAKETCGMTRRGSILEVVALNGPAYGGAMLKLRSPKGDRSVLIREAAEDSYTPGVRQALWDDDKGALLVPLQLGTA